MRFISVALLLLSTSVWSASPTQTIEQLSVQISPLWKSMRPVCVMAQDAKLQSAVNNRLEFLDSRLVANAISKSVLGALASGTPQASKSSWKKAWNNQAWSLREQLETMALKPEDRENLREYFFKLQTQTPSKERGALVQKIQHMSEALNLSLRQELWKTCHSLGLWQVPQEQVETAVSQRWLKQSKKVEMQLHQELAAFYFYSFRQVQNPELTILANVSEQLDGWVELASLAIQTHFTQLRSQLVAIPLILPAELPNTGQSTDGPFTDSPWGSTPSHKLPQL